MSEEDLAACVRLPVREANRQPGRASANAADLPGRAILFSGGRAVGAHHQAVQRCVERALVFGALAALDDRPRPGREPTIPPRPRHGFRPRLPQGQDLGYPHELWTTRLLARHAREHGPAEGHACLGKLAQGTLCKILNEQEIKPHKVRYYLERRDPEFKQKMAEVLCVYREVRLIKETAAAAKQKPSDAVAIVSYDEKPGIQAIATTAPDLPPEPGRHATFARDYEYKRLGTVSLLAGIDLLTGRVALSSRTTTAAANSLNSSSSSTPPGRPGRGVERALQPLLAQSVVVTRTMDFFGRTVEGPEIVECQPGVARRIEVIARRAGQRRRRQRRQARQPAAEQGEGLRRPAAGMSRRSPHPGCPVPLRSRQRRPVRSRDQSGPSRAGAAVTTTRAAGVGHRSQALRVNLCRLR